MAEHGIAWHSTWRALRTYTTLLYVRMYCSMRCIRTQGEFIMKINRQL